MEPNKSKISDLAASDDYNREFEGWSYSKKRKDSADPKSYSQDKSFQFGPTTSSAAEKSSTTANSSGIIGQ